jgi:2-oxoglutarate-Fe(II)-dependent dioxygenase family protein
MTSDLASTRIAATVERMRRDLAVKGYARATDDALGVPPDFRKLLVQRYFDGGALGSDVPDVPADRERARDVVRYSWRDGALALEEHDTVAIVDRGEQAGRREYNRVRTLDDELLKSWIAQVLSLVPADRRAPTGTFGVNLMRTHTLVVTKPHRDDEEFIVTYVVDRVGEGAETHLYDPETGEVVFRVQLDPGDLLIFEDARFLHNVTRLEPWPGSRAHRDALVCTVDYRPA